MLYRKTNQAENMIVLIPEGIKKVWNEWNIRGFILFSLLLQIFLLFTASLRKKTANKLVIFTIWSAYLLADWAASFAIGLVFNSEVKYTSGPGTVDDTSLLMVLWTPFLLLLVGGQDRITSFAIEDNELWLRHLIWLILQVFTTGFVFIQSLHQNRLWMPTLLLLIAGIIKYAERTAALYLASSDSFGISLLTKPDPGPNYEKLMSTFSNFKENGLPTIFNCLEDKESQVGKFNYTVKELDSRSLVKYAYHFANMYKGLIVNLIFSSRVHKESRDFFSKRTAEDTLRILEITLNFFYDILHTKIVAATSKIGIISRCISIGLVLSALSLFYKEEKHGFQRFDVKVTYTLFFGISGLDLVTLLLWLFSDWAIASLKKYEKNSLLSRIFDKFLDFKKPRWKQTADTSKNWFYCRVLKGESQGGSHDHSQQQWTRTTPIIFKRWSETLSQYNFVDFCWEERSKGISRSLITSMLEYFHVKEFIDPMKYVLPRPLTKSLWEFIINELLEKSEVEHDPEGAKRIFSARGEWVLADLGCIGLMPYVTDFAYDESLLLWHIATELCYRTCRENCEEDHELSKCKNCEERELSKCLSDYMLYLLYQQPSLMSEVSGIAKQRFRDTWAEAERFFSQRGLNEKKLLYKMILDVKTELKPVIVKGNRSKSVLFDASMLANEIKKLDSKWKVTSKVWVEMLSYAASRSRGYAHVQQLSRGGEFLTFVWLLMAQFGLREAWVETRFSTKLSVDK